MDKNKIISAIIITIILTIIIKSRLGNLHTDVIMTLHIGFFLF